MVFRAGFRCFFLGAALFSAIAIALWLYRLQAYMGMLHLNFAWHVHEMLFGYVVAVLAGFLTIRLSGRRLAFLFALWLVARVLLAMPESGFSSAGAVVDLLFIPVLIALREPALWSVRKWPNGVFLPLLAAFWLVDLAFYLSGRGTATLAYDPNLRDAALDLFAILLVAIGGRLVPGYTGATLISIRPPRRLILEFASILSLVLAATAHAGNQALAAGLFLLVAAAAEGLRMITWRPWATRHVPLLWILHLGYGWLIAALALRGIASLSPSAVPASAALHALTVGAIGSLTVGMMSRLTLVHTRQPVVAGPIAVAAFVSIQLAAVVRVLGPLAYPARVDLSYLIAALLWSAAFALWLVRHAPLLVTQPTARDRSACKPAGQARE